MLRTSVVRTLHYEPVHRISFGVTNFSQHSHFAVSVPALSRHMCLKKLVNFMLQTLQLHFFGVDVS